MTSLTCEGGREGGRGGREGGRGEGGREGGEKGGRERGREERSIPCTLWDSILYMKSVNVMCCDVP